MDIIQIDKTRIKERFFNAALGWLRYKPLFIYLTNRGSYHSVIQETMINLQRSRTGMAVIFGRQEINDLLQTFAEYSTNVCKHYQEYVIANELWNKIKRYLRARSIFMHINNNRKQNEFVTSIESF